MRRVLTALLLIAALPLLLTGLLWAGQERMIFIPSSRPLVAPPGWERLSLRGADGLELGFLVAEGPPGSPVILHFHGNGGTAGDRAMLGSILRNAGYTVVLAEYRGYGGNPGRPGEAAFAADAEAYLAWVAARYPGQPVALWGESLGTAMATRLAAGHRDVAALVLESPFTSVADLARGLYPVLPVDLLLRHRFESLLHLGQIGVPVLVIGSEADRVTPAAHARRMAEAARDGELVMLPGGAHPAVLNDETGQGIPAALTFLGRVLPR